MATYDTAVTFATEAGVFRYASFTYTTTSIPTDEQVYQYARDVAAVIVLKTEKAGSRTVPPTSGVSDTFLARLLQSANECGAAFYARRQQFVLNGDERSKNVAEMLASQWEAYCGKGSAQGGALSAQGEGGLISDAITTASDARVLSNDLTQGHVTLASVTSVEVSPTWTMDEVD